MVFLNFSHLLSVVGGGGFHTVRRAERQGKRIQRAINETGDRVDLFFVNAEIQLATAEREKKSKEGEIPLPFPVIFSVGETCEARNLHARVPKGG